MKQWFKHWTKRMLFIMALMGPGIITAIADNDAAGISTYTLAASSFGYQILIILIPMTILLAVTQEIGARIAIVAEKGLADLIREQFGVRMAIWMYALLFFINLVVIITNVSGIKSALALFGLNPFITLPLIVAGLYFFVVRTKYSTIEKFFFILIGFYVTYVVSAFLSKPDWAAATRSLFVPSGTMSPKFLYVAIAVVGTTITAWGQFFINSYVKDKRISVDHIKYNKLEVYASAIMTNALTFFIMVAVAVTIFQNQLVITDAAQASVAIRPFAGNLAGVMLGIGLLIAGILGCIIVALTTAYAFSEFFGYSGSLDEDFHKSKLFYSTLLVQLVIATLVVMLPQISLFSISLIANFINGIFLPVVFYFLYKIANNESVMGQYKNNHWQNFMLVGASVVIMIATSVSIIGGILGW
ncbi:MAG: divalent metal cation transporter [Patescibacteria group bacterium]